MALFFQLEQYLFSLGPGIHKSPFGRLIDLQNGAKLLQRGSEPLVDLRILAYCLHNDFSGVSSPLPSF
jgi:hypothetical protein